MIEPLLDNVLIEPADAEKVSTGGVYLHENTKEAPQIGKVLAIGVKVESLKKTDKNKKVVYKKWMGNEIKHEGKKYILISEKDILGVIK